MDIEIKKDKHTRHPAYMIQTLEYTWVFAKSEEGVVRSLCLSGELPEWKAIELAVTQYGFRMEEIMYAEKIKRKKFIARTLPLPLPKGRGVE